MNIISTSWSGAACAFRTKSTGETDADTFESSTIWSEPPPVRFLTFLIFKGLLTCTQMTLHTFSLPVCLLLFFPENYCEICHIRQGSLKGFKFVSVHFPQRLLAKKKKKNHCGGCRRPCLVGGKFLCLVFGMVWLAFDLFMWMQNKGPHYGLFAVCVGGEQHFTLKAALRRTYTINKQTTMQHFQG